MDTKSIRQPLNPLRDDEDIITDPKTGGLDQPGE